MIIKKADSNRVNEIVDLWLEFMDEHDKIIINDNPVLKNYESKDKNMGESYKEFLKSYIESDKGIVYLAEENEEIIGYTLIFIKNEIPIYENKKVGYISDLYVKKDFRKKGISTQLKDRSLEWFKDKGIKIIAVPMYPDNKHAHSLYKKWGFIDYKFELRKII